MTAFNVVRFRVKPGRDQEFIAAFKNAQPAWAGMRRISVIKTGEGAYCSVGEWKSFDHIAQARPMMIGILDSFRHCLEDLGGGLGVTDPVSGSAVLEVAASAPAKGKAKAKKKPAKKAKAKKKKAKKKKK